MLTSIPASCPGNRLFGRAGGSFKSLSLAIVEAGRQGIDFIGLSLIMAHAMIRSFIITSSHLQARKWSIHLQYL
jgi:hypothetical protein